jgi:CRP/FNR family transcriptional regulator, cyclic AMP receptor protein
MFFPSVVSIELLIWLREMKNVLVRTKVYATSNGIVVIAMTKPTQIRAAPHNPAPAKKASGRPVIGVLDRAIWAQRLNASQRERIEAETQVRYVPTGGSVCKKGEPVEHWIGVLDGLVKIYTDTPDGRTMTFSGVPAGGWLGEGSLLKSEPRRYDVAALRDSVIAYVPRSTFEWLLDSSLDFNRFLMIQINERLGQFIAQVECDRLMNPDARVARTLGALFNPMLYPGSGRQLQISQEEIGYLTGVSRQRVNQALQVLEREGLLKTEYGGVSVLDLHRLQRFGE